MELDASNFPSDLGYLGQIPKETREALLAERIVLAKEILTAEALPVPEHNRLRVIVQTALEARALYF